MCETPTLKEYEIKKAFLDAMEIILKQKEAYITHYNAEMVRLNDTSILEEARNTAEERLQEAIQELQELIYQNATFRQDQTVYNAKYEQLKAKVDQRKLELKAAKEKIVEQTAKKEKLRRFIRGLESCAESEAKYSDELFILMIDHIEVKNKQNGVSTLVFKFTDGTEITIKIQKDAA